MHIDLKLGLSCNNACVHCVMEPARKKLERANRALDSAPEAINRLVDRLLAQGITSITLTGGEPTLREDFFTLLDRLSRENLSVFAQTNGRRLARAENLAKLERIPKDNIVFVIAMHSHNRQTHDAITRREGSFDETVAAIKGLKKLGFKLCGKMVLSRKNVFDIKDALALYAELGFDEVVVAYPHAQEFGKKAYLDIAPEYSLVKTALKELGANRGIPVYWETIPFCQLPAPEFYAASVDLQSLGQKMAGGAANIEMSVTGERIDWQEKRLEIKRKSAACGKCLLDKACEGPWEEYIGAYGESEFVPVEDPAVIEAFLERL
ncbi:MAG: radical SAM protein [Desulfovibrio sp.]|nr:radical SAM protein [Desulfovibrio sp.]